MQRRSFLASLSGLALFGFKTPAKESANPTVSTVPAAKIVQTNLTIKEVFIPHDKMAAARLTNGTAFVVSGYNPPSESILPVSGCNFVLAPLFQIEFCGPYSEEADIKANLQKKLDREIARLQTKGCDYILLFRRQPAQTIHYTNPYTFQDWICIYDTIGLMGSKGPNLIPIITGAE
jgi:hypothetical protein